MGHYKSNLRDIEFNLFEVFQRQDLLGSGPYPDLDEAERWATDSYWSTGLREIITELRQARAALDFYRRDRNRHRENEKRLRNWIWELGLCGPPGSEIREAASKVLFDG